MRAGPVFVDDRTVAIGSPDGSIVLYDVAAERVARSTLQSAGGGILALDASPEQGLLVSAADDGLVRVWQTDDRGLIDRPVAPGWSLGAASADGSTYALWSPDGSVEIRFSDPSREPITIPPPFPVHHAYHALHLTADGSQLVQRIDWPEFPSIARILDSRTGEEVFTFPLDDLPITVVPTPGGDRVYVFTEARAVELLDLADGSVRARVEDGELGLTESMSPSPDGRFLDIVAGATSIARLDAETLAVVDTVDIGFFAQGSIARSGSGDVVFVAGIGGRIARVDMTTGEVATGRSRDVTSLAGIALSPDGGLAVSQHPFTAALALFDAATLQPVGQPIPAGDIVSDPPVVFTGDGAMLANARFGVNRWELDPDVWAATACRVAGRNLTPAEWAEFVGDEPYRATCPASPTESAS
jgi:WD40 repeat protein